MKKFLVLSCLFLTSLINLKGTPPKKELNLNPEGMGDTLLIKPKAEENAYVFKLDMTCTAYKFTPEDINASWQRFEKLSKGYKKIYLIEIQKQWLKLKIKKADLNFWEQYDYPTVLSIDWHYDATQYLINKVNRSQKKLFLTKLEKVALFAISANLENFEQDNLPARKRPRTK